MLEQAENYQSSSSNIINDTNSECLNEYLNNGNPLSSVNKDASKYLLNKVKRVKSVISKCKVLEKNRSLSTRVSITGNSSNDGKSKLD